MASFKRAFPSSTAYAKFVSLVRRDLAAGEGKGVRQSGERLERWRAMKGETGTCGAYGERKGKYDRSGGLGRVDGCVALSCFCSRHRGGGSGLAEANMASLGGGRERKSNEVNVKRYERGMS